MDSTSRLICHLCGQEHRCVPLNPGERALCVRCEAVLAKGPRLGPHAALVFSVTGLVLVPPALLLTFMSAGKLGAERACNLFTGVGSLWDNEMRSLALLVLLCGGLVPIALLATLAAVHVPQRVGWPRVNVNFLFRLARVLEHWAIPEVQVLAVLVALMKLGSLVNVAIGPGFWCYCGMALSLLIAEDSFDLDLTESPPVPGGSRAAQL